MAIWFDSWESLYKIFTGAVTGYVVLVIYIRLMGKRATSKMNNFDWIVTVALGSVYASMVLLEKVSVADGVFAMGMLFGLQYLLTASTARWAWARRIFLATPSLLFYRGEFLHDAMRKQRISEEEILSAVREVGLGSLEEAHSVTLEPDANLAVVKTGGDGQMETVRTVPGYDQVSSQGK